MGAETFQRSVEAVPAPGDAVRWFARWVAQSCRPGTEVLNIGAGCDRSGSLRAIRRRHPHLVGIDPSDSVWSNPALDQRFQQTLEDFARAHEAAFDVAFAVFVLEHVADPAALSRACASVLRPAACSSG